MTQGALVQFRHDRVEIGEERLACGGDGCVNHPPVGGLSLALDQTPGFEAVEQAGQVGIAGDHPAGDFLAGDAKGRHSPQDSQDVVLGGGQSGGL